MIKLPNRRYHNLLCSLFGIDEKKADRINQEIDLPVKEFGASHRRFRHDMKSALLLSMLENDPEVLLIHRLHVLLDSNRDLEKLIKILK